MHILLITAPPLAQSLREALEPDSYRVETCEDIDKGDYKAQTHEHNVIVLDRTLLRGPGYSYLLGWRRGGVNAHVLVLLPQKSTGQERAEWLDAGADAYLLHPVSAEELRAHLRVLRRRRHQRSSPMRHIFDLEIDTAVRTVKRGGKTIHLTPREFDLLLFLVYHQGKVVTRTMIREHLYQNRVGEFSNVVDVYIRYLRGKIDKGFDPPLILTRWGQGYVLRADTGSAKTAS